MKKGQFLGILIFFFSIILVYFISEYIKNDVSENKEETIGYVNGYFEGSTRGPKLKYFYIVDDEKYEGFSYVDDLIYKSYNNKFFRLNYSSKNPAWSEILLSRPVTDTSVIKAAGLSLPKKKENQFQKY